MQARKIDLENDDVVTILRHPGTLLFYDTYADNGALLARAANEIERLRKLIREASEVAGMGRCREACEMLQVEVYPDDSKEPSGE